MFRSSRMSQLSFWVLDSAYPHVLLTDVDCICAYSYSLFFEKCGLFLCLWSLLELQGRAGHGKDEEVGGVGWQNRS